MTHWRVLVAVAWSSAGALGTFIAQLVIPDAYAGPLLVALVVGFAGLMGWIVRSLVAIEGRVATLEGAKR